MRYFGFVALAMAVALHSQARYGQCYPTVTLKTQLSQSTAHVGDTLMATVTASVSGGSAADGLIAYDVDVFPLVKSGIDFVGSAEQPPGNSVSMGIVDPVTGGLLGITGIYDSPGVGIGASVTLFSFQVHADAPGANSVSAGLSVYPNGTGVPFILNVSGDYVDPAGSGTPSFSVDTSQAVAPLTVLPAVIPEPGSGLLLGAALVLAARITCGRGARNLNTGSR